MLEVTRDQSDTRTFDGPVRGSLRIEVGTSSAVLEAGRPFSILVTIRNPFDIAVEINAVTTVAPVDFVDLERHKFDLEKRKTVNKAQDLADSLLKDVAPTLPKAQRKKVVIDLILSVAHAFFPFGSLFRVAYDASQVIIASSTAAPGPKIEASVDVEALKAEIVKTAAAESEEKSVTFKRTLDYIEAELKRVERDRFPVTVLNPGNSVVQLFTLKTTRSLFFPPSSYDIPIQVSYKIQSTRNQESIKYNLNIRSPLYAVITGSIFGSIAGFLLKDIFEEKAIMAMASSGSWSQLIVFIIALTGNVILAVIMVVAFARKRETQPFISVEDFWGGLFVGAVAGYAGKSLIHGLLTPPASSTTQ